MIRSIRFVIFAAITLLLGITRIDTNFKELKESFETVDISRSSKNSFYFEKGLVNYCFIQNANLVTDIAAILEVCFKVIVLSLDLLLVLSAFLIVFAKYLALVILSLFYLCLGRILVIWWLLGFLDYINDFIREEFGFNKRDLRFEITYRDKWLALVAILWPYSMYYGTVHRWLYILYNHLGLDYNQKLVLGNILVLFNRYCIQYGFGWFWKLKNVKWGFFLIFHLAIVRRRGPDTIWKGPQPYSDPQKLQDKLAEILPDDLPEEIPTLVMWLKEHYWYKYFVRYQWFNASVCYFNHEIFGWIAKNFFMNMFPLRIVGEIVVCFFCASCIIFFIPMLICAINGWCLVLPGLWYGAKQQVSEHVYNKRPTTDPLLYVTEKLEAAGVGENLALIENLFAGFCLLVCLLVWMIVSGGGP